MTKREPGGPARVPQWIACRGEARSVVDSRVSCPRGDLVAWELCLECHLLETVDDERDFGCGDVEVSDLRPIGVK